MGTSTARKDAVVLWTGGKDSFLALLESRATGLHVRELVTFGPPNPNFKAHPIHLMRAQAESLGVPHRMISIAPPFERAYDEALAALRGEGVGVLISGDIDEVAGHENWMFRRAHPAGVKILRPLWHRNRRELLQRIVDERIQAVITAAREPPLSKEWVGRRIDRPAIEELATRATVEPLDLCGENGEYHTMVIDGPGFRAPIQLPSFTVGRIGGLNYMATATSA